jgi:hypothetical protein
VTAGGRLGDAKKINFEAMAKRCFEHAEKDFAITEALRLIAEEDNESGESHS